MNVKELMTPDVTVIDPGTSVQEAARMMRDGDFGAIPVGAHDRLLGMVTDRDIAVGVVAEGKDLETPVGDVMSDDLIYCFENDSLEAVEQKMSENQVRRLPVLNAEKRFVGIISLGDLAKDEQRLSGEALSNISEDSHREPARH